MASHENRQHPTAVASFDPEIEARLDGDLYESDTGRSNFTAFVLGGVAIAGGLLGFLYYDADNLSRRDGLTTGSLGAIEAPVQAPTLTLPRDSGAPSR